MPRELTPAQPLPIGVLNQRLEEEQKKLDDRGDYQVKVLWLGSLLPRLLMAPNGSQWLPTTPDSSLRLQTHAVCGSQ